MERVKMEEMKMEKMVNYMVYLRGEYETLCKSPDNDIKEISYRSVIHDMFIGLTYGISLDKLETIRFTINNYRNHKNGIKI